MEKYIIAVASGNPVKIAVGTDAFKAVFPGITYEVIGKETESGVPAQPFGDEEIFLGAQNRLENIRESCPQAGIWISLEGGVFFHGDDLFNYAWVLVQDREGRSAKERTGTFKVPSEIAKNIRGGMDLSQASELYFQAKNLQQTVGGIHHITGGLLDRKAFYLPAAIIALSEIKNHHLY